MTSKAQTLKIFDEDEEEEEEYNSKEDEGSGDDYIVNNSNYNSQRNQYTRLKDYLNYNKNGQVRPDKQNKRNQQFKNQFKGFTSSEVVGGSILNKNNVKYDTYQENIHDQDSWEHPKIGNKNNYYEKNDKGLEPNNENSHSHFDPKNNINIYQPSSNNHLKHQHIFTSNKRNNNYNKGYNRSHYNNHFPRKKVAVIDGNHMKPSQSFFSSSASSTSFPSLALLLIFSVSISSICEVLATFEVYIKKIIYKLMYQIVSFNFFFYFCFLKNNIILAFYAYFPPRDTSILSEYHPRKEAKKFFKKFFSHYKSKLFKIFHKVEIEIQEKKNKEVTGIIKIRNYFTGKKICMQKLNFLIGVNNKILKFFVMKNLSSMRICIFSKKGFGAKIQVFEKNNAIFLLKNNITSRIFNCRAVSIDITEFNLKRTKYNLSSKKFFKPKQPIQNQRNFRHKRLFLVKISSSDQSKHLLPLKTNTDQSSQHLISSQEPSYLQPLLSTSSIKSLYQCSSIASRLSDA